MTSDPVRKASAASNADLPEWFAPAVSLVLIVHVFCVCLALSGNLSRSLLQSRILVFLAPYTQLLHLDANLADIDLDVTPYQLTHATIRDVDHQIEVLPVGKDGDDPQNWIVLGAGGARISEDYHRYQRLAKMMVLYAEREELAGVVAQRVAANFLAEHGVAPSQVRCRRHFLQQRDWLSTGSAAERDPYNVMHYATVYTANVIIASDGRVLIIRSDEASQVASPITPAAP